MKIVLDTNVLISWVFGRGITINRLVGEVLTTHHLFTCDEILAELKEKMVSPRLQKFIEPEKAAALFQRYAAKATKLEVSNSVRVCRDPDDDIILALAIAAEADVIISGDNDLLVLHPYHDVSIVTPSAFVDRFIH